jgi:Holliday junction resolvase
MTMGLNSQKKGKRFELQVAKYLSKEFETSIRRTPNSGGLSIKGDIMATQGI